jgi:hypothetical protein
MTLNLFLQLENEKRAEKKRKYYHHRPDTTKYESDARCALEHIKTNPNLCFILCVYAPSLYTSTSLENHLTLSPLPFFHCGFSLWTGKLADHTVNLKRGKIIDGFYHCIRVSHTSSFGLAKRGWKTLIYPDFFPFPNFSSGYELFFFWKCLLHPLAFVCMLDQKQSFEFFVSKRREGRVLQYHKQKKKFGCC